MPPAPRLRDFLERQVGKNRPSAPRYRVLLLPPPEGHHDRRRCNDYDRHSGVRSAVPPLAPALDEHFGHSAPWCREVIFETCPELEFNSRMTAMQAAVGRFQPTRLPAIPEERRAIAREY